MLGVCVVVSIGSLVAVGAVGAEAGGDQDTHHATPGDQGDLSRLVKSLAAEGRWDELEALPARFSSDENERKALLMEMAGELFDVGRIAEGERLVHALLEGPGVRDLSATSRGCISIARLLSRQAIPEDLWRSVVDSVFPVVRDPTNDLFFGREFPPLPDDISPPVLRFRVEPVYPVEARGMRIKGHVLIVVVIDGEGRVGNPYVMGANNPIFSAPTVEAMKRWRFKPARVDRNPVPVLWFFTVDFPRR